MLKFIRQKKMIPDGNLDFYIRMKSSRNSKYVSINITNTFLIFKPFKNVTDHSNIF